MLLLHSLVCVGETSVSYNVKCGFVILPVSGFVIVLRTVVNYFKLKRHLMTEMKFIEFWHFQHNRKSFSLTVTTANSCVGMETCLASVYMCGVGVVQYIMYKYFTFMMCVSLKWRKENDMYLKKMETYELFLAWCVKIVCLFCSKVVSAPEEYNMHWTVETLRKDKCCVLERKLHLLMN
jgi:hypothetical protein